MTTNPALPSQIVIDGVLRDTGGLNWLDLQSGSYNVSFTHVQGYTEPAPQVVSITAGATTLAGNFTQRGSLRVTTSPGAPAAMSVDGSPRDDWGGWTDLPGGLASRLFRAHSQLHAARLPDGVGDRRQPDPGDWQHSSSPGAPGPTGTGQLRVTTSPALPSQILLNGVPMDSWG